jgi:hypothetical protein
MAVWRRLGDFVGDLRHEELDAATGYVPTWSLDHAMRGE